MSVVFSFFLSRKKSSRMIIGGVEGCDMHVPCDKTSFCVRSNQRELLERAFCFVSVANILPPAGLLTRVEEMKSFEKYKLPLINR